MLFLYPLKAQLRLPQNNPISRQTRRNIDDPLVAASPVREGKVFERFDKPSVDHDLAQGQQVPFRRARGSRKLLVRIAGIDPDWEARQLGAQLVNEVCSLLSREKGSPPASVKPSSSGLPAISSMISRRRSGVKTSPKLKFQVFGLKQPGQRWRQPLKKRTARRPSPSLIDSG